MHSVVKNLLARKNQKGPFDDGRKIALVLPGGVMSGVVGAGALLALEKLGLNNSFDVIYSASAGFPNASYFLTENCKVGATIYYEELKDRNFINFFKIWKPVDFDRAVESIRTYKILDYKKIWETKTELYLKVDDILEKSTFLRINDQNPSDYFEILREAISFPLLSKGGVVNGKRFFDGQITDKDIREFLQHAIDSDCTDILIIYNQTKQRQVEINSLGKILEIIPDKDISKFETKPDILKSACGRMEQKVLEIFNQN
jgi:predicted patatin/cPLA2 family phospholipase